MVQDFSSEYFQKIHELKRLIKFKLENEYVGGFSNPKEEIRFLENEIKRIDQLKRRGIKF